METPKYQHDCCESIYLGTWCSVDGEIYDLYACTAHTSSGVSLMARYGNEGHEYISGHIFNDRLDNSSLVMQIAAAAYREFSA